MLGVPRLREARLITHSPAETCGLGERIGKVAHAGSVLALIGDLGAGKTVLIKGVAAGLGAEPRQVTSPTFILMSRHEGRLVLYHFDAYRLGCPEDMLNIGADEAFYGNGVSVIEWADRVAEALPADRVEIHMTIIGETDRTIRLSATGTQSDALLSRLAGCDDASAA